MTSDQPTHAKIGKGWTPTANGLYEIKILKRTKHGVLAQVRKRIDKSDTEHIESNTETKT